MRNIQNRVLCFAGFGYRKYGSSFAKSSRFNKNNPAGTDRFTASNGNETMKAKELVKGRLYVPRDRCLLYCVPIFEAIIYRKDTQQPYPKGLFMASFWVHHDSNLALKWTQTPVLYLGTARENWSIEQYYYRVYRFHWGLLEGKRVILNHHTLCNLRLCQK